jgi:hypothetical protein
LSPHCHTKCLLLLHVSVVLLPLPVIQAHGLLLYGTAFHHHSSPIVLYMCCDELVNVDDTPTSPGRRLFLLVLNSVIHDSHEFKVWFPRGLLLGAGYGV